VIRVVCGLLIRRREILVARRSPGQRDAGLWELPGGKVEHGESRPQALRRELEEELGLVCTVGRHVATARDGRIELCAFAIDRIRGTPVLTVHDAVRWVGAHELGGLPMPAVDRLLFPAFNHLLRKSKR